MKETYYLLWKKETPCLCIIYLPKMSDMRNSKPINCLDADSFSGHESWEGGCLWSWTAPEPSGPADWTGEVGQLCGLGCLLASLRARGVVRSNALRSPCRERGASQKQVKAARRRRRYSL